MPQSAPDLNVTLGILAVQLQFITGDVLAAVMTEWAADPTKPIGSLLVERGFLDTDNLRLLETLVGRQLGGSGRARPTPSLPAQPRVVGGVQPGPEKPPEALREDTLVQVGPPAILGGRFRTVRFHQRGGVGEVWVAVDQELRREVALKELQPGYADHEDFRDRFVREAEITGYLEHPGVVPVYALGRHPNGRRYYAMRFIRGETLRETVRRFHLGEGLGSDAGERLLARNRLLRRFIAVCDTVHFAHSRGVVHRDIKPGNVMLGPYGETLLVDWGLAKFFGTPDPEDTVGWRSAPSTFSVAETGTAGFVGTPQYASPEQVACSDVGPASDIYSLGATFYTLLTNRAPFEGEAIPAVLERVQQGDFPTPLAINARVPKPLEAICLKAMALHSEDRYPTARALGEDIERFLDNEPVRATQPAVAARRHPMRISVFVVGTVVAGVPRGALFRSEELTGPIEIGRQQEGEETFTVVGAADRTRVVVVGFQEDQSVSRHQALLNSEEPGRVVVRNLSLHNMITTRGHGTIGPGEERSLALPVELVFRERSVFVESAGGGLPSGLVSEDTVELGAITDGERDSDSAPGQDLIDWLRALGGAVSADRNVVFQEALRSLRAALQLNWAMILIRDGGGWQTGAADPPEMTSQQARAVVLNQLLKTRRAVWHTPTIDSGDAEPPTFADMTGIFASPILSTGGHVVGAIYGTRDVTAAPPKQQVQVEAMFLELVAALLAPRIVAEDTL